MTADTLPDTTPIPRRARLLIDELLSWRWDPAPGDGTCLACQQDQIILNAIPDHYCRDCTIDAYQWIAEINDILNDLAQALES